MILAVVTLADVVGLVTGTDTDVDTGATTVGVEAMALTGLVGVTRGAGAEL